jgi:ornithine cyclodeaminase/alanine dehydrogenase-like protein (mu-crystallin family)
MFRSLGLGIEDLAAAEHVLAKALENGVGITVDPS